MMNGALYISFFQGQLESALEHVVQLAVQEITKTVGSSLTSMLQETTTKDQENQRLRLRLKSRQSDGNASVSSGSNMEGNAANDGTKSLIHTPSQSSEHALYTNTHWLEEKGRALGQLKVVMEQVLKFALAELTKIVEDSFDDLLQELLKKEKENQCLSERVQREEEEEEEEERAKGENHTGSPSRESRERPERPVGSPLCGSEALQGKKAAESPNAAEKQTVLSVTQDWVPILDKVFGQKWCRDLWQVKDMGVAGSDLSAPFPECIIQDEEDLPIVPSGLAEVGQNGGTPRTGGKSAAASSSSATGSPGCSSPATTEGHRHGDDLQLRSPSMLHRLLTLPAQGLGQLLCADSGMDMLPSPAAASPVLPEPPAEPKLPLLDPSRPGAGEEDEDEEEEEREEEEEGEGEGEEGARTAVLSPPLAVVGRKTHGCRQCGKRFSRLPLLKAHQQTHGEVTPSRCSLCGKRFLLASRLQAHLRTHAGKHT